MSHILKSGKALKEPYSDFLQRLTKAIHKAVSFLEVRKQLTLSLALEHANLECKRLLILIKVRSIPIEKWIQYSFSAVSLSYNEGNLVGQDISNVRLMSKSIKRFNCGKKKEAI